MPFRTLDDVDVAGKRVLLRADLNVPVRDGKITDLTRLERLTPTIRELAGKGAKVIVCSHFDRPKGKRVPAMSLAPIAAALGEVLGSACASPRTASACAAQQAVDRMARGDVLVLENTRYHAEEENERPRLRRRTGQAGRPLRQRRLLRRAPRARQHRGRGAPAARLRRPPDAGGTGGAGRRAGQSRAPVAADRRRRQGFHQAGAAGQPGRQGERAGDRRRHGQHVPCRARPCRSANRCRKPRCTPPRSTSWRAPRRPGARSCCRPTRSWRDELKPGVATQTVPVNAVPADAMILDVGPATVAALIRHLASLQDAGVERPAGRLRNPAVRRRDDRGRQGGRRRDRAGALRSVAGGGDTVSALRHAGVLDKHELRLDRRRRVPGMAGGQDAARCRRAGLTGCEPPWPVRTLLVRCGATGRAQKSDLCAAWPDRRFAARPVAGRTAAGAALPEWRRIALRNEAHIRSCDLMSPT